MTELGDHYYEEASSYQVKSKKRQWVKGVALAACLCLAAAVAILWDLAKSSDGNNQSQQDHQLALVATPTTAGEDSEQVPDAACMVSFFIYQGRVYEHYQWIDDTGDIAGAMLGSAVASIDEYTPLEDYKELTGSVGGDFYEVKGFDPGFMLAMKAKPGETTEPGIAIFTCINDIRPESPADLLEKHFRLSRNFVSAEYESGDSWYNECGERYPLSEEGIKVLNKFLCQLSASEFVSVGEALSYGIDLTSIMNKRQAVLYLNMKNGLTVTLMLNQYGYVNFGGVLDLYAQVPAADLKALLMQFTELDQPDQEPAGVILPPVRFGRTRTLPLPVKNYDLRTAVTESDLVARVKVLNWLGEDNDNLTTCFEAEVLDTIKGQSPRRITLLQDGSSEGSSEALFTHGTELFVFLRRDKHSQHKNVYRSTGGPTTTVFIVKDDTGTAYALDKHGNLTRNFDVELVMKWVRPGSKKYGELRGNWKEQDPYLFNETFDDYYKHVYPYDAFVAKVKSVLAKADPEATTAD